MVVSSAVENYLDRFDGEMRRRLDIVRSTILSEVPEAEESLSYGMVGYKIHNKPLVYFGGFKNHVGFFATPNGHEAFKTEFAQYKQGKGSVQFPLDKPLPIELIKRVTKFRKTQSGDI